MIKKNSYKSAPRAHHDAPTLFGSRTDVGCVRDHNEDSLVATPPLFAIADGMGGHAAGEVASEIAVATLLQYAPEHPDSEALTRAVEKANREIIRASHDGRGREGMGTTLTAAMLEGERIIIAQIGDSRAYLLHRGNLQQITRDHSLMADMIEAGRLTPEEARVHPQRSVITRALGNDEQVCPDIYEINAEAGDRLLLCSDGLSGMVRNEIIERTMRTIQDPQRCASQLVNDAIAAGGHDNVTVIVVDVAGFTETRRKKMARKTKIFIALIVFLLATLIGSAAWAANTYLNTVAYLADDNGKVAIYRGVPDTLLGFSLSHHERTTDVAIADLQPGTAKRMDSGIRVDTVEHAEKLIAEYEAEANTRNEEAAENSEQKQESEKQTLKEQQNS